MINPITESGWVRPSNQDVEVQNLLWHQTVVSAVTGEAVNLQYYSTARVSALALRQDGPAARAVQMRLAYDQLEAWIDDARHGWAYLPGVSPGGLLRYHLQAWLDRQVSDPEPYEHPLNAIRVAEAEWAERWGAAARLGARDPDPERCGWKIPIVPLQDDGEDGLPPGTSGA